MDLAQKLEPQMKGECHLQGRAQLGMADELRTFIVLELDFTLDGSPASPATFVPSISPFATARLHRIDTFKPRFGCETHRHCSYLVRVARVIGLLHIWIELRPHQIEAL